MKAFTAICIISAIISYTVGHTKPINRRNYYDYYGYDDNYDISSYSYTDYYEEYYNYENNEDSTTSSYDSSSSATDDYSSISEYSSESSEETSPWGTSDNPVFALVQFDSSLVCYGTIVNQEWALTSASCTYQLAPSDLKVKVASRTSAQEIPVQKIVVHPNFDKKSGKNNIALLKLARPVRTLRKHPLQKRPVAKEKKADTGVIAVNAKNEKHPKTLILKAALSNSCKSLHGRKDRSELCVKVVGASPHVKSCPRGAAGTPFIVNHKLRGIYSSGDACKSGAIFTDVNAYKDFISKVTH